MVRQLKPYTLLRVYKGLDKLPKIYVFEFKVLLIIAFVISALFNMSAIKFVFADGAASTFHIFLFKISILILVFQVILFGLLIFYFINQTLLGVSLFFYLSASLRYFSDNFGIIFDESLTKSIFATTPTEASQYLNTKLILLLIFNLVIVILLPLILKYKKDSIRTRAKNSALAILCICLVTTVVGISFYKDYASFLRNNRHFRHMINPISPIYETTKYLKNRLFHKQLSFVVIGGDAKLSSSVPSKKKTIVLILGETARADHFSINGYLNNQTTPLIEKLDLVSFTKVSSCGTATAISVPCLFSNLGRKSFSAEMSENRSNLLDVMQNAGYEVLWLDNNTGCQGVCDRVKNVDLSEFKTHSFCQHGTCYDEILVKALKHVLNPSKNQLIVLHTLGSHGPSYYLRYPEQFAQFKPSCDTSELSNCTKEEVINAYDNTILYTDFIISEIIKTVSAGPRTTEKAVLYLSDHGESLGESGLYLHSLPFLIAPNEQKHIPYIFWFKDFSVKNKPLELVSLNAIKDCINSHDYFFSTILNLAEVSTSTYNRKLDLLSLNSKSCEKWIE